MQVRNVQNNQTVQQCHLTISIYTTLYRCVHASHKSNTLLQASTAGAAATLLLPASPARTDSL
jgi:hypothetical protein